MDKVEIIQGSVIQHGHHNDRIYLMHLHGTDNQNLIAALDRLATEHGYGKIFAKIPATCWHAFRSAGYVREARIPRFFKDETDGLFVAKFFSLERQQTNHRIDYDQWESVSPMDTQPVYSAPPITACTPADADALATIYRRVFESYAFPVDRPAYLARMMGKNAFYFCIRIDRKIAAAAAAEIDPAGMTCEMTDFATLPEYRGRGLAGSLLRRLDAEAKQRGVKTAFTIARADSQAMNRIFHHSAYRYAGRLIKNTQIAGRIRSMTVWYKQF